MILIWRDWETSVERFLIEIQYSVLFVLFFLQIPCHFLSFRVIITDFHFPTQHWVDSLSVQYLLVIMSAMISEMHLWTDKVSQQHRVTPADVLDVRPRGWSVNTYQSALLEDSR